MKRIHQKRQAIVIGGSIGGLITARVLRNHFDKVTIIEKDKVNGEAESRKGQPHTNHLHGLLPAGLNSMMGYFPDLMEALKEKGANIVDFAGAMHWYTHGGYRKSFNMGLHGVTTSRPLLEQLVKQRVLGIPGIQLIDQVTVKNLITAGNDQRITGVVVDQKAEPGITSIHADLVVDTSGRGSKTFGWLDELGFKPPSTSEVKVNVGYATRYYERDPSSKLGKKWVINTPHAPLEYRSGGAFPIEGNRWIVSLGGWHGDHAPLDNDAFIQYAQSLPTPDIYKIVSTCKPVSPITQFKYPSSLRRHFEKMNRFPPGYLVMGDALCSFNPIYGQGMTVVALQAELLDELLKRNIGKAALAKKFFRKAAGIINIPWDMAVGEDFRYPETTGPKPLAINIINKYITKVHKATLKDQVVCEAFLKVMSLLKPPSSLFHPKILWRVLMP